MQINTQIKRGYIALAGILTLGAAIQLSPKTPASEPELTKSEFVSSKCKTGHQARWKLASTPLDIPALPLQQIRLCRA